MRLLAIVVVAAVVGGGVVYGALLYLGQNPVHMSVQFSQETPSLAPALAPAPTAALPPTTTALATAVPPTVLPTSTLRPTPTVASAPTLTPMPTLAGPTEREMVVSAFADCNGKYSGEEKWRRLAATNSAIDRDLRSVASIRALVEEKCGGVFPDPLMVEALSSGTPAPVATLRPTVASRPTATPVPMSTPTPAPSPELRHLAEKRYMLELINAERTNAGVGTVTLGDNIAAQLHAEAALENCFSSHWGIDGLKPYMRYSLAGGYQSNGENGSGLNYCIRATDGYSANSSIRQEVNETMDGWMSSPGHRRNLLDPQHKKVSIGIAWDRYNKVMYQHFEGDYVGYEQLPTISSGVLSFSGMAKNGVQFSQEKDLGVQIYYDPPPHELGRGQVARTYCYDNGRPVAGLRWPLTGGYRWTTDTFSQIYKPCPSPYEVAVDAPAPRSYSEAHRAWQEAYRASQSPEPQSITVPWITASEWTAGGTTIAVKADISEILQRHGDGVYSLTLWGKVAGDDAVISQYSIFHGVTAPDAYNPSLQ